MNRSLVGACGSCVAALALVAGCENGPKTGDSGTVAVPLVRKPFLTAARTLDNYHQNFAAKTVAMHITQTVATANFASYWVLFDGQNCPDTDTAIFEVDGNNTSGEFLLVDGAAYVKIDAFPTPKPMFIWPIIVTQHIVVGAEGTEFIVQNDVKNGQGEDPHSTQRVFLLDKPAKPLHVNVAGLPEVPLVDADTYAEYSGGKLSGPTAIPTDSNDPLRLYVNAIKGKATNFCK